MSGYVELGATTNFSFLRGASHPQEYVVQAAAYGLAGIGIADRNTVAGLVRAHSTALQMTQDGTPIRFMPHRRQPADAQGRVPLLLHGDAGGRRGPSVHRPADGATA